MSLSAFGNTNLISEIVSQNIGEMERDQLGDEVFCCYTVIYCICL